MIITYSNDFQCVEYVLRLDLVAGSGTASWTYFYELRDVFLRNTTCGLDVFLRITSRISTKYFFYEILKYWKTLLNLKNQSLNPGFSIQNRLFGKNQIHQEIDEV